MSETKKIHKGKPILNPVPPFTTVTHINQNQKYRMVIERAAVKGVDGFKVEANSDSRDDAENDVALLYAAAKELTTGITEIKTEV